MTRILEATEVVAQLFAAAAEARRIRDIEWREWLAKVLEPEDLDAAESAYPPPDLAD